MKKQQVFYIHGGEAYSNYDAYLEYLKTTPVTSPFTYTEKSKRWTDDLRTALGGEYDVAMPVMPNKHCAKYTEWKIWFERHFEFLNDELVLIGWSQGACFLAKYLSEESFPVSIKKLILLAAPYEAADFGGEDGGDFMPDGTYLPEIQSKVEHVFILHSKDDFVVPYEHALKYKEALPKAELITFEDKNHFLVEELPELVELIKKVSGE